MSAIWGFINLNTAEEEAFQRNKAELMGKMDAAMEGIRFEHVNHSAFEEAFFACGQSFYTPESEREVLPCCDASQGLLFTADVVLDNRDELFSKLVGRIETLPIHLPRPAEGDTMSQTQPSAGEDVVKRVITDAELLKRAYRIWGKDCVHYLRGAYTAVFYDREKQQIFFFDDHCGSRCLYYTVWNGMLVFSTLLKPILALHRPAYNEKWFAFCELFYTTEMFYDEGSTPYEGIFMLPPGCACTIETAHCAEILRKHNGAENKKAGQAALQTAVKNALQKYWNPVEIARKLGEIKETPEELKALFVDTVQNAVEDCMRSAGGTGITLSSGLDSSTVAAFAARKLQKTNEKLYSFTSVPLPDFKPEDDSFAVANESKGIEPICRMYGNIVPTIVSCEGKSVFSELERFVEISEMPCKSNFNLVWIEDIYRQAEERGIRLMLKGQYGNSTISYGAVLSSVLQLMQKLRFKRAYTTIHLFKARMHVPKKQVFKVVAAELKERRQIKAMIESRAYAAPALEKKYHSIAKTAQNDKKSGGTVMDSRKRYENFVYSPIAYQMLGMYDTKLGLAHNLIVRDPAKDKRVVEMCLRMPPDFFVQNGIERYGIRGCMEGIVPKEVRMDINHRGLQSADLVFRSNKGLNASGVREKAAERLKDATLKAYVSEEKLNAMIGKLEGTAGSEHEGTCNEESGNAELGYEELVDTVNVLSLELFLKL